MVVFKEDRLSMGVLGRDRAGFVGPEADASSTDF